MPHRLGEEFSSVPALAYAWAFVARNGPPDHFVYFVNRSSPFHSAAQAIKLGAKRRVDHARADLDDETAEQRGIDFGVKARFLAQLGLEHSLEFGDFAIRAGYVMPTTGGNTFHADVKAVKVVS